MDGHSYFICRYNLVDKLRNIIFLIFHLKRVGKMDNKMKAFKGFHTKPHGPNLYLYIMAFC